MQSMYKIRIVLYFLLAVSLGISLFASLGNTTIDMGNVYIDGEDEEFFKSKQTGSMEFDATRKILTAGAILCEIILAKHHMTSSSTLAVMLCGVRCLPLSAVLILTWLIPSKIIHFSPNVWGILWLGCNIASFILHIVIRRKKKAMASNQPPSIPTAEGEWVYVPK